MPKTASRSLATLYVADLHPNVTEADLYQKFSRAGPVHSIRVCRDAATNRSFGYAYVNFKRQEHAKFAMESMHFDSLYGRPMRIMYSNRDSPPRPSEASSIFIKNLCRSIDSQTLHNIFSLFGEIFSCKVATDEDGNSRGYAYVRFKAELTAVRAIEKMNGFILGGKMLYVSKYISPSARMKSIVEYAEEVTSDHDSTDEELESKTLECSGCKTMEDVRKIHVCSDCNEKKFCASCILKNHRKHETSEFVPVEANKILKQVVEATKSQITAYQTRFPDLQDKVNLVIGELKKKLLTKGKAVSEWMTKEEIHKAQAAVEEIGDKFDAISEDYTKSLRTYVTELQDLLSQIEVDDKTEVK